MYHVAAALATLAQVVIVGFLSLFYLTLGSPPGTELVLLILKAIIAISWLAFVLAGLAAWKRRDWIVVAMPIGSLGVLFVVDLVADNTIHPYLNWGY